MREKISFTGGLLATIAIGLFAGQLRLEGIHQSILSWVMWAILDGMLWYSLWKADPKRQQPWIVIGYTAGAILVAFSLLSQGNWKLGAVEALSITGVIVSTICWKRFGARKATISLVAAINIAGLPILWQAWQNPTPGTDWYWITMSIAAAFAIIGSDLSFEQCLLPTAAIAFNTIMLFLLHR